MHKLALVAFVTACTTGLSWTGGMHGGTGSTASNSSPAPAILPSTGHSFDLNRDCFGEHGRVDYHRDPILLWPCFDYADDKGTAEYSELAKNCDEVNEALKSSIACHLDHKSFDAHFAAQAKIPKAADRDGHDPGGYSSVVFSQFSGRAALVDNTLGMLAKPAAKKEFLAKVNSITVAYDDERGGTALLQGKNLVLFVNQSLDSAWVFQAIRRLKAFPALEAFVQEYGACKGGYSC